MLEWELSYITLELWPFTFYIWIKEDRTDDTSLTKKESILRIHVIVEDSWYYLGLTWKEKVLKYLVIMISDIIQKAIKLSSGLPGGKSPVGTWGFEGCSWLCPASGVLHQVWTLSWQRRSVHAAAVSDLQWKWVPELNIFSAKPNILRFFFLLKVIPKSLWHFFFYFHLIYIITLVSECIY